MNQQEISTIITIMKDISSITTPIILAAFGILILRRTEKIKNEVARRNDFQKKWADQFFDCCQLYLRTLERQLALLSVISQSNDPENSKMIKELSDLNTNLSELELRIRRNVVFAPKNAEQVKNSAGECIKLLHEILSNKGGSVDAIISQMDKFNQFAKRAHEEMVISKN